MPKQLYIPLPDGREFGGGRELAGLACLDPGLLGLRLCTCLGMALRTTQLCKSGTATPLPPRLPSHSLPPPPAAQAAARMDMVQRQLGPGGPIKAQLSEADLQKIVARTEGYSGCALRPLRLLRLPRLLRLLCRRLRLQSADAAGLGAARGAARALPRLGLGALPAMDLCRAPGQPSVPAMALASAFFSLHIHRHARSDMKNLIQEACQGPLRDACKAHGADVSGLTADALRPVVLRDFQVAGCLRRWVLLRFVACCCWGSRPSTADVVVIAAQR